MSGSWGEAQTLAKIVIIDDEELICDALSDFLRHAGHEVFVAPDGAEGIALVEEQNPSVVLVDIVMPTKDGIEVIQELSKANEVAKIVAMSGGGRGRSIDYLAFAKKLGADHVLYKPFDTRELLDKLDGWFAT